MTFIKRSGENNHRVRLFMRFYTRILTNCTAFAVSDEARGISLENLPGCLLSSLSFMSN